MKRARQNHRKSPGSAAPKIDRAAVMRDAHRNYRIMAGDWDFAHCLRFAWTKALIHRERAIEQARWIVAAPTPRRGANVFDAAIAARRVSAPENAFL